MKKALYLALALLLTAGVAYAADDVAATKHNLLAKTDGGEVYQSGTTTDQVCVFCHTPHNASTSLGPLWNMNGSGSTYTMYNSGTMDMIKGTAPGASSLACLTCHDGVGTIGVLRNLGGTATTITMQGSHQTDSKMNSSAGAFLVGTDLSYTHPVAITYNTSKDNGFKAQDATLHWYGTGKDQLECGTCHNPHNNSTGQQPMLRSTNAASALCKKCHIK
jgi:predicted CXXCH cytochrome family protein